jgi:hypothetical protein
LEHPLIGASMLAGVEVCVVVFVPVRASCPGRSVPAISLPSAVIGTANEVGSCDSGASESLDVVDDGVGGVADLRDGAGAGAGVVVVVVSYIKALVVGAVKILGVAAPAVPRPAKVPGGKDEAGSRRDGGQTLPSQCVAPFQWDVSGDSPLQWERAGSRNSPSQWPNGRTTHMSFPSASLGGRIALSHGLSNPD